MDKRWRMAADRCAREYRVMKAYLSGVDATAQPGHVISEKEKTARNWVWAIEAVERQLCRQEPEKHRFFLSYYALRARRGSVSDHTMIMRLCDALHVSHTTLCDWRMQVQEMLVLAATQAGQLRPFDGGEAEDMPQRESGKA